MNTATDTFLLRFTAFDAGSGGAFSHYDMASHGHEGIGSARKRLGEVNHFRHGDCFVDLSSLDTIGVVRTVEIVPAAEAAS